MDNCPEYEELIERIADGEASEGERESAEAHASGCRNCREALRANERLADGIRGLERPDAPEGFRRRVMARAMANDSENDTKPASMFAGFFLAAAGVLIVAGIFWVLFVEKTPQTEVASLPVKEVELLVELTGGARIVAEGAHAGLLQMLDEGARVADNVVGAALEGFSIFDTIDRANPMIKKATDGKPGRESL